MTLAELKLLYLNLNKSTDLNLDKITIYDIKQCLKKYNIAIVYTNSTFHILVMDGEPMPFSELLEYCINIGFESQDINNVDINDLEEFLNSLDMKIIKDDIKPGVYYVDLDY